MVVAPGNLTAWMTGAAGPVAEGSVRAGRVARACGERSSARTAPPVRAAPGSETEAGRRLDSGMRVTATGAEAQSAIAKWVQAAPAADLPGG